MVASRATRRACSVVPGKREKEGERGEGRKERSEEGWGWGSRGSSLDRAALVDSRKKEERGERGEATGWLAAGGKGGGGVCATPDAEKFHVDSRHGASNEISKRVGEDWGGGGGGWRR